MASEGKPPVWGLWNSALGEWFNPGTRKPYFPDAESAHRRLPLVMRQYPYGTWEVKEYPLEDEDTPQRAPGEAEPAPARP